MLALLLVLQALVFVPVSVLVLALLLLAVLLVLVLVFELTCVVAWQSFESSWAYPATRCLISGMNYPPLLLWLLSLRGFRSRTFAVLNARRPSVNKQEKAKAEKRLPQWMPPPKVFPIIWISIGFLRAISTTLAS